MKRHAPNLYAPDGEFGTYADLLWGPVMRGKCTLAEAHTVLSIDDLADLCEMINLEAAVNGLEAKGR